MQLEARLLRKRHCLPEGLAVASVRPNTLWISNDRGRPREGSIESDRLDPEAVRNDLDVNTATSPTSRRRTERRKSRPACRTSGRSRDRVSPEHQLGKPVIRAQRFPHGRGKTLLRIGAQGGCACGCRNRCLIASAATGCEDGDRKATDGRRRPHAANPRDSSWLRKRGPALSHRMSAPLPSKSGLVVRRFPSTPWTSTISSTWRGRKRCSPCS